MNQYKTLPDILCAQKNICDKGITIIHNQTDETFISFQSFFQKILYRLYALQTEGIKPGDEIILQIHDLENFITSFWAGLLGGFIMIPLAIPAPAADEHYRNFLGIFKQLDNPYILTDTEILPQIRQYISSNKYKRKNTDDYIDIEVEIEIEKRILFISQLTDQHQSGQIRKVKPSDIAFIQYSSGSTGNPKGVVLTHKNLLSNINAIIHGIKGSTADISLSWMPLTHDMGLIGFHLVPLAGGAHQILIPVSLFARRPLLWLEKASQHQATVLGSPSFGLKLFLSALKAGIDYKWNLSSIRLIFNGAEPINPKICTIFTLALKKYNLKENVIFPVYGLAEATLAVTFPLLNEKLKTITVNRSQLLMGSRVEPTKEYQYRESEKNMIHLVDVGSPVQDCQVKIVDSQYDDVAENTIGHILIKGRNVSNSYYNDRGYKKNGKELKASVHAAALLEAKIDGWLDTGDLGFLRKDRLVVTGREKDMIVINGRNFYLHDLERLIEQVEGIKPRKSAICSIYNHITQEEDLYVFLIHKKPLDEFIPLGRRLTGNIYQQAGIIVKQVIPVERLPITTSGKPMRHVLVQKYLEGEFSDTIAALQKHKEEMQITNTNKTYNKNGESPDDYTNVETQLLAIISGLLNLDIRTINTNDNLNDYGIDSLKLPLLFTEVEKIFPDTLQLIDCFDHPTISELSALIVERKNNKNTTSVLSETAILDRIQNRNNDRDSVYFYLDIDTSIELTEIARKADVPMGVVLLSLTINLFKQVYKKNLIRFHTFMEENVWNPLHLDLSHIEFFSDLILIVHESLHGEKKCRISPINSFSIDETGIPVFYRHSVGYIDKRVKNHDLIIIYKDESSIVFDFNIQRYPKRKMQHLAQLYIQLIQKLVDLT